VYLNFFFSEHNLSCDNTLLGKKKFLTKIKTFNFILLLIFYRANLLSATKKEEEEETKQNNIPSTLKK